MGGKDSITGLILGTLFICLLPELLSFPASASMISALSMAILAVILVVVIVFLPGGLVQLGQIFKRGSHG